MEKKCGIDEQKGCIRTRGLMLANENNEIHDYD